MKLRCTFLLSLSCLTGTCFGNIVYLTTADGGRFAVDTEQTSLDLVNDYLANQSDTNKSATLKALEIPVPTNKKTLACTLNVIQDGFCFNNLANNVETTTPKKLLQILDTLEILASKTERSHIDYLANRYIDRLVKTLHDGMSISPNRTICTVLTQRLNTTLSQYGAYVDHHHYAKRKEYPSNSWFLDQNTRTLLQTIIGLPAVDPKSKTHTDLIVGGVQLPYNSALIEQPISPDSCASDPSTYQLLKQHIASARRITCEWAPDGIHLAIISSWPHATVYILNTRSGKLQATLNLEICQPITNCCSCCALCARMRWSPDSTRIAITRPTVYGDKCSCKPEDANIVIDIYDTYSGSRLQNIKQQSWNMLGMQIVWLSNDVFLSEEKNGVARIWRLGDQEPLYTIQGNAVSPNATAFFYDHASEQAASLFTKEPAIYRYMTWRIPPISALNSLKLDEQLLILKIISGISSHEAQNLQATYAKMPVNAKAFVDHLTDKFMEPVTQKSAPSKTER